METQALQPLISGGVSADCMAMAISPLHVNLHLAAESRDGVLHELVALVVPPMERRLSQTLFKALKAREELCSTCVDNEVAIPHARNAMVGVVERPVLAYGRHQKGIEFGALDGRPVRHFFLLCAPNVREHLQVLSRLSRLLNRPSFREELERAGTPEAVVACFQKQP